MKQIIRLTESDLHKVIKETVKNVLNETFIDQYGEDWEKGYEADLKRNIAKLNQRKIDFNNFKSNPKIQKLEKMGFEGYIGNVFDHYDGDVSNVEFKEILNYVKHLRSMQNEPYEDYSDYNTKHKRPTLQSLLRGEMMG